MVKLFTQNPFHRSWRKDRTELAARTRDEVFLKILEAQGVGGEVFGCAYVKFYQALLDVVKM